MADLSLESLEIGGIVYFSLPSEDLLVFAGVLEHNRTLADHLEHKQLAVGVEESAVVAVAAAGVEPSVQAFEGCVVWTVLVCSDCAA